MCELKSQANLSLQDEPIVLHINAEELTQRAGVAVKKLACRCCVRQGSSYLFLCQRIRFIWKLVMWARMLKGTPLYPQSNPAFPTLFSSMGYCILFVHGLSKLCTCLNRCGATTLTVSTVLLLLLFSWKTVKQNEIWLSRESLFRYE